MSSEAPSVISLFSGAMGLDQGLEQAGFSTRVAVECNRFAAATIRQNKSRLAVIQEKIENLSTNTILDEAGLAVGEATLVTGGPSCQPFSNVGQRQSVNDPRGGLFREFIRVVREAQPRFFIMENVRGILSAAVKHRPLIQRGPGYPPLAAEEELGSAFELIVAEFEALGYHTAFDLVNTADYGVPQSRERLIFIGSRDGHSVHMPQRTHSKLADERKQRWVPLQSSLVNLPQEHHRFREFSDKDKMYLRLIPEGGNWHDLPDHMREDAIGKAYHSWGGRGGFLRRLKWNLPSPTLTTNPNGRATMLCHPEELRPLSVQEYARLQQFPDGWQLDGSISQQYIQVGNAVPVGLGRALGQAILRSAETQPDASLRGQVVCPNNSLLERLSRCHRTQLNPIRMRQSQDPELSRQWLHGLRRHRNEILRFGLQPAFEFTEAAEG